VTQELKRPLAKLKSCMTASFVCGLLQLNREVVASVRAQRVYISGHLHKGRGCKRLCQFEGASCRFGATFLSCCGLKDAGLCLLLDTQGEFLSIL
jgi:hypothetical protein